MLAVQETLAGMTEVVKENLVQVQQVQKQRYDRNSRDSEFAIGDQVPIILPDNLENLLAQWQAPMSSRKSDLSHLRGSHARQKEKVTNIPYVIMLWKWHKPMSDCLLAEEVWMIMMVWKTRMKYHCVRMMEEWKNQGSMSCKLLSKKKT